MRGKRDRAGSHTPAPCATGEQGRQRRVGGRAERAHQLLWGWRDGCGGAVSLSVQGRREHIHKENKANRDGWRRGDEQTRCEPARVGRGLARGTGGLRPRATDGPHAGEGGRERDKRLQSTLQSSVATSRATCVGRPPTRKKKAETDPPPAMATSGLGSSRGHLEKIQPAEKSTCGGDKSGEGLMRRGRACST